MTRKADPQDCPKLVAALRDRFAQVHALTQGRVNCNSLAEETGVNSSTTIAMLTPDRTRRLIGRTHKNQERLAEALGAYPDWQERIFRPLSEWVAEEEVRIARREEARKESLAAEKRARRKTDRIKRAKGP